LMGITRSAAIEIARTEGFSVEAKSLELDDLLNADEAFFTGTAAEITPIREVDASIIGAGKRGAITEKIQTVFFDAVNGRDERFAKWLQPVEQFVAFL
jgi:branched-chain amino acid aminotransferase